MLLFHNCSSSTVICASSNDCKMQSCTLSRVFLQRIFSFFFTLIHLPPSMLEYTLWGTHSAVCGVSQDEVWQKSGVVEMLQRALEICRKDHESGCEAALKVLPFHKTVMSRREQAPSTRWPAQQDDRGPMVSTDLGGPLSAGLRITIKNGAPVCAISPTNIVVRNSPIGVTSPLGTAVPLQPPVSSGAPAFRTGEAKAGHAAAGVGRGKDEAVGSGARELHRLDPEGPVQPNIIIIAQPRTGMRTVPYQSPRAQLPIAPLFGRPTITSSQSGPVTGTRAESRRVDTRSLSSPGRLTSSGYFGPSPFTNSLAAAADRAVLEADRAAKDAPPLAADAPLHPPHHQAEAPRVPSPVPGGPGAAGVASPPPASRVVSKRLFEDTVELPTPISAFVKPLQAQGVTEERSSAEREGAVKVEGGEVLAQ